MSEVSATVVQLSPDLYQPTEDEVAFFKSETGIRDDGELEEHILRIQREAWDACLSLGGGNVVHYGCIRSFGFTKLRIKKLPGYPILLQLAKEKPDAIFLDFASAFGVDTRAAIADGYPVGNVVTSDLQQVFWDIGQCFDPNHIAPSTPLYTPPTNPRPELSTLTSLTPLRGHVSAIHATAFFHLFQEEQQLQAARALASLLSPEKGSFIFGSHSALREKGMRKSPNVRGEYIYCHNPDSWRALWNGVIFEKGTVDVSAELVDRPWRTTGLEGTASEEERQFMMVWVVKRI